ncbi:Cof-type HAD-IIB family hydrolase [Niallia endozanthoxylica]|uniref:Cof-type HAD-IIB family hydrolase n=1 Tax=Niallia endozanthoxylica TaxID=2036016 RepID=UPI00295E61E1|nr:Cof-type HAD-IIB family hydrolase [Niallia endozanthoxylica]
MIKLLALDLDGTLLDKGKYISQRNIEAIQAAIQKGIEVVIATGRANFDAQNLFEDIPFNPWIIGTNGATIHKPNGELFYSAPLEKSLAISMLKVLEEKQLYYEAFIEGKICAPQYGRELLFEEMEHLKVVEPNIDMELLRLEVEIQFNQSEFMFIPSYQELLDTNSDIYNILAYSFDEDKLKNGWSQFTTIPDITIVQSGVHNFHLQHKQASKGNALKILAKELQIHLADCAAVGDNYNDLSMLEIVGLSSAMGNADKEIKDACDFVTKPNNEDGVAFFIESFLKDSFS